MADMKLKDGREITFDISKIKYKEYKEAVSGEMDTVLTKTTGLSVEELEALDFSDVRLLMKHFWKAISRPIDDPNSESVPTSA